ncbi:MAG TPA: PepSY domain-containing protein [Gemmatimonadaceae bacterium]|nr:PepSY domain-containing protein [Gemmatimonadaceae bacterium]
MRRITRWIFGLTLITPAVAIAQSSQGAPTVKIAEDKPGLLKRARVSGDSAIKLAMAAVPNGRVVKGEIEEEKGRLIYSFDIKVAGKKGIEEIHIDPATGAVLDREHENDARPAKKTP